MKHHKAWFINLFCTSIDVADKSEELDERLNSIKEHFLRSLFVNTSTSLFEEDKIVYSFLLACNLGKNCEGAMETEEWQFFLQLVKGRIISKPDFILAVMSNYLHILLYLNFPTQVQIYKKKSE